MSNKKIDKLMEEFFSSGQVLDVLAAPPVTYVVIALGRFTGVGYMRCRSDEEYVLNTGLQGALRKALKHIKEQREEMKLLRDECIAVVYNYSDVAKDVFKGRV